MSKAIDANGEPNVLFNQTKSKDIEFFDIYREGAGSRDEMMPYGVYLKPSDNDIGLGDVQMPLFTKITNPVVFQTRTHLINYLLLNVEGYKKINDERRAIDDTYKVKVDEASQKEIALYEAYYQAHKDTIENRAEAVRLARELDEWENLTDTLLAEWKEKAAEKELVLKKLVNDHFLEKGYDGLHLISDSGSFGRHVETFLTFHPENVKSATQNLGTFSQSQNIYYQIEDDQVFAEENYSEKKLKEDANLWKKSVDKYISSGIKPKGVVLMLPHTPLVMKLVGAKQLPLYASHHLYDGIFSKQKENDEHNIHNNIDESVLKALPEAVADPIAIFRQEKRDSLLFMLDVKDNNGSTVVVPVLFNSTKDRVTINVAKTVFTKDKNGIPRDNWFTSNINNLLYLNKLKESEWAGASRANSLQAVLKQTPLEKSIKTEEDLVKLKKQYIQYYQLANENDVDYNEYIVEEKSPLPKMMAIHNIAANSLVYADRMGGLPVPSIAVLGEEQGEISGFGDIFLIGTADMVNPEKVPVFDRDVWSIRYPQAEYDLKNQDDAKAFVRQFTPVLNTYQENRSIPYINNFIQEGKVSDLVDRMQSLNAFKAFYIENVLGKTIAPVFVKTESKTGFGKKTLESFIPLYDAVVQERNALHETAGKLRLKDRIAARVAIEQKFEAFISGFADNPVTIRDFEHDLALIQPGHVPPVDQVATQKILDDNLGSYGAFRKWVENQAESLFTEPYLTVRGEKVAYNLENITKVMLNDDVKGQEKSMTFGDNKAKAMAATRFLDTHVMRRFTRQLKDKEAFEELSRQAKEQSDKYRALVAEYKPSDDMSYWEAYDASMKALSRWMTRKNRTEEGLKRELERVGFKTDDMPQEVLATGVEAGNLLLANPVPYFEAKPQRIVELSEFAGAVIPQHATDEIRDILEKHDIRLFEYDEKAGDQKKIIRRAAAVLSDDNLDTFFQFVEAGEAVAPSIPDEAGYRQRLLELALFLEKQGRTKEDILSLTGWTRQNENLWTYRQDPLSGIHHNYPELSSIPSGNTEDARLEIVDWVMQKEGYVQQSIYPEEMALTDRTFFKNALFAETLNTDLNTRIQTAQFLTALASNDELFLYPKITNSQDFETILRQIDPGFTITETVEHLIPQEKLVQEWTVRSPDNQIGYMRRYTDGGISLNVENFKSGQSRGSALILSAITYAHNNGYQFEGDREGYNELGMNRAFEHLLSAALKFGTTRHLNPSVHLREKMNWQDGDDLHNIAELIKISYQNTCNQIPKITHFRYNFTNQIFERMDENGQWRPDEDIRGRNGNEPDSSLERGEGAPLFSRNTFKRAILIRSCLSRILERKRSQGRDEVLVTGARHFKNEQHPSAEWDLPVNESLNQIFYHNGVDYNKIRGTMTIMPDGVFSIGLFKNANYSTFTHEVGHVLLELYKAKASQKDCPDIIREDFSAICRYLGVLPGTELKRRHHEKFARSFEAYLREGKAPNRELAPVFSRFKDWLVSIYRNIRQLDVELTPEIRQVFDRMVSTDDLLKYQSKTRETPVKSRIYREFRTPALPRS